MLNSRNVLSQMRSVVVVLVILVIPMKEKPVVVNLAVRVLRNVKQVNVFVRLLFVELNPMLTAV